MKTEISPMRIKLFVWDTNRQGEGVDSTIKRLEEFSKKVEILFITQGIFNGSIMGYTIFYKDKL